jgi:hypothetical protein
VALAEAGESAAVTVVATGPAAAPAAQDAAVAAAAHQFGARLGREATDVLVAETNLMPGPPVEPAGRHEE